MILCTCSSLSGVAAHISVTPGGDAHSTTCNHSLLSAPNYLAEALRPHSHVPPVPSQGSLPLTKAASSALSSRQFKVSCLVVNWCHHHPPNCAMSSFTMSYMLVFRSTSTFPVIISHPLLPAWVLIVKSYKKEVPSSPLLTVKAAPGCARRGTQ